MDILNMKIDPMIVKKGLEMQDDKEKKEIIDGLEKFFSSAKFCDTFNARYKNAVINVTRANDGIYIFDGKEYFPQPLKIIITNILIAED